jgi:beta-aspartyl-dipeptidase (metallo-type)
VGCTLIVNGEVFAPEPLGTPSLLLVDDKIIQIGELEAEQLQAAGLPVEVIDAAGGVVVPGLIDPHEHLTGAGGEQGFATRLPEVSLDQIVQAGITTVVGLLGTDTITRDPKCLFGKVHQLLDEGLSAYMYTGGFELPARTITGAIVEDAVFIDCVIGTGEVALSDPRWIDPPLQDLAHAVAQTVLAGKLTGKAGVTHFHIGPGEKRLALLRDLVDQYEIEPSSIYVTHITRSEALMDEAIALAERGAFVDMDAVEENIVDCLGYYRAHGGSLSQITASSDAHTPGGSPEKFFGQFVACIREFGVEQVVPVFSTNAAAALKLKHKGRLEVGFDADVLVLQQETLEIQHLFARGRAFILNGERVVETAQQQGIKEGQV